MIDLNQYAPTGWILEDARGINDAGQIVGFALDPSRQGEAYLLTPSAAVPAPGGKETNDAAEEASKQAGGGSQQAMQMMQQNPELLSQVGSLDCFL